MKKILGSFMALVMLLGCSSQSQETQNSDTQNQTAVKGGPVFLQIALPHTAIQSYVPSRLCGWVFLF